MYAARLIALMALTLLAQGALANTIWLKDRQANVCINNSSGNAGGIIGLGGINANGTGFTMTIDNPAGPNKPTTGDCANIPATTSPLVFASGTVAGNIVPVSTIKPGTNGANECLDQGSALSGVNGSTTNGTGLNQQTLSFNFSGSTAGCRPNTFQAPFTRAVVLTKGSILTPGGVQTLYQGYYHIFDVATIPEPSSILLILAGFLGMGFMAWRRPAGARSRAQ